MAKKLEEHLYRSAHTREEYLDPSSLKRRLHLIAKGVGVPKNTPPNDQMNQSMGGPMAQNLIQQLQQNNLIEPLAAGSQGQHNTMLSSQQMPPQMLQQLQMQQVMQNQSSSNAIVQIQNANDSGANFQAIDGARKKQVLQQQQKRLMLLRHSKLCKIPSCKTKFCPQMIVLWKHLKFCRGKTCPVPHCVSSRCVLSHHRNCKRRNLSNTCEICGPVKMVRHICYVVLQILSPSSESYSYANR